jgi:hypothetical protein
MKLFKCQACAQMLYFENRRCENCSRRLGYLADKATLTALEPAGNAWLPVGTKTTYRFCANADQDTCNWMVPADGTDKLCEACRHNRTIPNLADASNVERWRKMELAKHRLFYTLLKLDLPDTGLTFDFIDGPKVMTGHDDGVITIALKEADDATREALRTQMGEPYRTLLGHFRHEVGHFFWDRLVRDGGELEACRKVFGDYSVDYNEALKAYYANGAPADWQQHFVSAYASAHPWEDFAETWAHYLHIVDTLEIARAFGLEIHPALDDTGNLETEIDFDPHRAKTIEKIISAWLPVTFAVNNLNRSMGQQDLYPFILTPTVVTKLGFIHTLVRKQGERQPNDATPLKAQPVESVA